MLSRVVGLRRSGRLPLWLFVCLSAWAVPATSETAPFSKQLDDSRAKILKQVEDSQHKIESLKKTPDCRTQSDIDPCKSIKTISDEITIIKQKVRPPSENTKSASQFNEELMMLRTSFKSITEALANLDKSFMCMPTDAGRTSKRECTDLDDVRKKIADAQGELLLEDISMAVRLAEAVSSSDSSKRSAIQDSISQLTSDYPNALLDDEEINTQQNARADIKSSIKNAVDLVDLIDSKFHTESIVTNAPNIKIDLNGLQTATNSTTPGNQTQPTPPPNQSTPPPNWLALSIGLTVVTLLLLAFTWARASKSSNRVAKLMNEIEGIKETLRDLEDQITAALNSAPPSNKLAELEAKYEKQIEQLRGRCDELTNEIQDEKKKHKKTYLENQEMLKALVALQAAGLESKPQSSPIETNRRNESPTAPKVDVTPSAPATTPKPSPAKSSEGLAGNLVQDYNLARQNGHDAQDDFIKRYGPAVRMGCQDLESVRLEGGKSFFKADPRAQYFFAVEDQTGRKYLLPQFMGYRSEQNMMDGIFKYPPGNSENLKLKKPAYLTPQQDGWILQTPGEFVDA